MAYGGCCYSFLKESNPQPALYKRAALPIELRKRSSVIRPGTAFRRVVLECLWRCSYVDTGLMAVGENFVVDFRVGGFSAVSLGGAYWLYRFLEVVKMGCSQYGKHFLVLVLGRIPAKRL